MMHTYCSTWQEDVWILFFVKDFKEERQHVQKKENQLSMM